ncbi:MaoC family dehydratase [Aeromicrobium sp. CF4.19]|uniref:MaoC family dehydratase n=1 Tax=Aeromicrobium sp. CF4.19 TaxID=3373082 RepID=UPI003EE7F3EB
MVKIDDAAALTAMVGRDLGETGWIAIEQKLIDAFADTTGDHQWIHTDVERARREALGGTTIAHGYLTLSLLPRLVDDLLCVDAISGLNYGADGLRFLAPVPSGSRVRLRASVKDASPQGLGVRVVLAATLDLEGSERPALVADLIFLFFFEPVER